MFILIYQFPVQLSVLVIAVYERAEMVSNMLIVFWEESSGACKRISKTPQRHVAWTGW